MGVDRIKLHYLTTLVFSDHVLNTLMKSFRDLRLVDQLDLYVLNKHVGLINILKKMVNVAIVHQVSLLLAEKSMGHLLIAQSLLARVTKRPISMEVAERVPQVKCHLLTQINQTCACCHIAILEEVVTSTCGKENVFANRH